MVKTVLDKLYLEFNGDNMNNDRKEMFIVIILVFLALLVVIFSMINKKNDNKIDNSIVLLNDRNRFFEVSNCVDKFIKYVSADDRSNILKMFNSDYLRNNNITESNIVNEIPNIEGNYSFSANIIYQQQLNNTTYKYYVKGNYMMDSMDDLIVKDEYYIIVYFYTKNMTFSVEPYDGKLFKR